VTGEYDVALNAVALRLNGTGIDTIPVSLSVGKVTGSAPLQAQLYVGTEHVALFTLAK